MYTHFNRIFHPFLQHREKALKAFTKALMIDPYCTEAIIHLTKLYCRDNRHEQALTMIKKLLERANTEYIHSHIGTSTYVCLIHLL